MIELRKRFPSTSRTVVSTTGLVPCAGYIRVSSDRQTDGHSPELQRDAIAQYCRQEGLDLVMIESDTMSGHVVSREGYQKVLTAVRAGVVHCVVTYLFDRWGRDGSEWVARARELEKAGCAFISVKEGREEGGILRFIRAGLSEEYARLLAKRTTPAREKAAREGQHMGLTPWGYRREYPARTGSAHYQAGLLIPDENAPTVREMFRRAAGGAPVRTIAQWLNGEGIKAAKGGAWRATAVLYTLRNATYAGAIAYNQHGTGFYESAKPGDEFVVAGRHEGLIDESLFNAVQARLDASANHAIRSRLRRPDPLGARIFHCASCGGLMSISRRQDETRTEGYFCVAKVHGVTPCGSREYRADLAHEALLAQIKRLRFLAWDLSRATAPATPQHDERVERQRALEKAREQMKRHVRRFAEMVDDPSEEEILAHREVGAELSGKIRRLEAALKELPAPVPTVLDAKALYDEFLRIDLATLIDGLVVASLQDELRALVLEFVSSATITERIPERRSTWLRAHVEWTPAVQSLLDAGQIELGPDVVAPKYGTPQERQAEAMRRYLQRRKAGVVPPARSGLKG